MNHRWESTRRMCLRCGAAVQDLWTPDGFRRFFVTEHAAIRQDPGCFFANKKPTQAAMTAKLKTLAMGAGISTKELLLRLVDEAE